MCLRQNGEIHSPFPPRPILTSVTFIGPLFLFCYCFIYLTQCCKHLRKMCRLRFKTKEEGRKVGKKERKKKGRKGGSDGEGFGH